MPLKHLQAPPQPPRLVRATGRCCRCDSHFREEEVLAMPDSRVPGGVAYLEVRHLRQAERLSPPK
jgi:hypothetical protein